MLTTSVLAVALVAGSAVAQSTTGTVTLNTTYIDVATLDPQITGEFSLVNADKRIHPKLM